MIQNRLFQKFSTKTPHVHLGIMLNHWIKRKTCINIFVKQKRSFHKVFSYLFKHH
jgi:hypothetical protein